MEKNSLIIERDGNAWVAHRADFINLQESEASFGDSPIAALDSFLRSEYANSLRYYAKGLYDGNLHEDAKRCEKRADNIEKGLV